MIYADFNPETHKIGETYIKAYDGFTGDISLQIDIEYRYWGYSTLDNKYLNIGSLQSNWDEENSSAPSFVYNKPFYRYRTSNHNNGISGLFELSNEGTCATSIPYLNINERLNDYRPTNPGNITINVKWNNKEYNCRIRDFVDEYTEDGGNTVRKSCYVFGNVSSIDSNYSDTAPFLIYANYNPQTHEYGETYIVSQDGSTGEVSCEFRYSYEYWDYQKLDNKYLYLSTNVYQNDDNPVTGDAVYNSIESVKGTIPSVPSWAMQSNKPSYSASEVGADASGTATSEVSIHNTNTSAHNDIRSKLKDLSDRLNALADSDDTTLDQMSEIVTYIKNNKSLIDNVTTTKVNVADIIDNLTTNVSNKPLSAAQGVVLKQLIDDKASSNHNHNTATTLTNGFMSSSDKSKLDTVAENANAYTHPNTHPASMIEEDESHRFVSDTEKAAWNNKSNSDHNHDSDYLKLSGGTLTGNLILDGDPTSDNAAANKKYVDDAIALAIGTALGGSY